MTVQPSPIRKIEPAPSSPFLIRTVALSTLAIAITGVASAIFSNQMFAAIGYAVLGLSSALLWFWGSRNIEIFKKIQAAMAEDVSIMELLNQKADEATAKISNENRNLEQTEAGLKKELQLLKTQNGQLKQELGALESQVKKLEKEAERLRALKDALETQVKELETAYAAIRTQVQQFLSLNLEMGQTVGAFKEAGSEAAKTALDLESAAKGIVQTGGAVRDLSGQVALAGKSAKEILSYLEGQRKKQAQEIGRLEITISELSSANRGLAEQNHSLSSQVDTWKAHAEKASDDSKSLAASEERLAKTQAAIQKAIQELAAKREALAEENRLLRQNEERVIQSLKDFDSRIAAKQKLLADLNAQIQAKKN